MTLGHRLIDTPRVKLSFYHNLEGFKPGVYWVKKKDSFYKDMTERLIVEIHGFGRAIELVIE